MKSQRLICLAASCLIAAGQLLAQPDGDYLDEDDLFSDELTPSSPAVADPLEGFNRAIFSFNDFVYAEVFKPFSVGYRNIMPDPFERGISNFFENAKYPVRLAGNLLQFKFQGAAKETGKFVIDSTIGLGGFIKASKEYEGLETPVEDIGQALGKWGIGEGFYIVLPFLGPTNLRDFVAGYGDRAAHPIDKPWTVVEGSEARSAFSVSEIINDMPSLIETYESATRSAIDPYEAVKDGFSQIRAKQVEE